MAGVPKNTNPSGVGIPDEPAATDARDSFGHWGNGDANNSAWADTDRNGSSTRRTQAQASAPSDFRSRSQAEELGYGEITMFDGEGNPFTVKRPRDPWCINRPVGGMPDPNVGIPNQ